MSELNQLLDKMWADYVNMNPPAQKIHNLFTQRGDTVVNDHIALRTFNHPKVNISVLAKSFLESGYEEKGEYHFEAKKLYAKHFEHADENLPKIFISELKLEEFGEELNSIVSELVAQIPDETPHQFDFVSAGRPWEVSVATYEKLKAQSEYAAWMAAWGFRPNHFTVFINKLNSFENLVEVNSFLKENGFKLNDSGGEIKGSKEVFLEQSSTLAYNTAVSFTDSSKEIPACYYEFALRHPLADGNLYQGFVAKSADKIFESTDKGQ